MDSISISISINREFQESDYLKRMRQNSDSCCWLTKQTKVLLWQSIDCLATNSEMNSIGILSTAARNEGEEREREEGKGREREGFVSVPAIFFRFFGIDS